MLTETPPLGIINDEDATVARSVQGCLPLIAAAIDIIVPRLLVGGRVIYTGAGTSGRYRGTHPPAFYFFFVSYSMLTPYFRLGILDASEM